MDKELLSIQQVAKLTGLTVHTLRYYEDIGLLNPVGRATNGHRRYTTADVGWINFLNRLRATGMPIRKMQQYAELMREGNSKLGARRRLLEEHQQDVQEHIAELLSNLAVIADKINLYEKLEECEPEHEVGDTVQSDLAASKERVK